MVIETKYKLLLDFVTQLSQPKDSIDTLNDQAEWCSDRSEGHYDDCFSDGMTKADACTAIAARETLKQIAE